MSAEFPPKVLDAAKGLSAEEMKKKIDEAALVVKTTYWWGTRLHIYSFTLLMRKWKFDPTAYTN